MKNQTLTKGEMQVMNVLWHMDNGGRVYDIIARMNDPKPAYTTVHTFLKILIEKNFVISEKIPGQGKTLKYLPIVTYGEYRKRVMEEVKDSLFNGSSKTLLNFFVMEENISEDEIVELLEIIRSSDNTLLEQEHKERN